MEHLSSLTFKAISDAGGCCCARGFFDGWRRECAALDMVCLSEMGLEFPQRSVHPDPKSVFQSLRENVNARNQAPAEQIGSRIETTNYHKIGPKFKGPNSKAFLDNLHTVK
jgi:hypothetical protein